MKKLLSQRQTQQYPVAESFFNYLSLTKTWPELETGAEQSSFLLESPFEPRSEIQHWVLEIKSRGGECTVQALMNLASHRGLTLGGFYLRYEKEIEDGLIFEDHQGHIQLGKTT